MTSSPVRERTKCKASASSGAGSAGENPVILTFAYMKTAFSGPLFSFVLRSRSDPNLITTLQFDVSGM